jgi:hypothetical protein
MKLDAPNPDPAVDENQAFTAPWVSFFTKVRGFIVANSQSGTTAQRPTSGLSPGDKYMDTTLGYIIHVRSVSPVVWVNGAGTIV